jgi:C-terminal domain 7 of the ABC-three component (ABC-3C) systems
VRECVIHYVHAQAVRVKWADSTAVPDAEIRAYENDLKTRWRLNVQRQSTRSYPSPVHKGQDLLNETLSEDSVIQGQAMPKQFTCGSFHVLADFDGETDPKIGWHPEFDEMAKSSKDK